ncbi:hypothetical protein OIU74_021226, partial [Salix koriyanagi]
MSPPFPLGRFIRVSLEQALLLPLGLLSLRSVSPLGPPLRRACPLPQAPSPAKALRADFFGSGPWAAHVAKGSPLSLP